jgi:ribosomal protein L7/L12
MELRMLQDIISDSKKLIAAEASREMILVFLRDRGLDQIDSIKVIRNVYEMSMADAKDLLNTSCAWADKQEETAQLHEAALAALYDLARTYNIRIKLEDDD